MFILVLKREGGNTHSFSFKICHKKAEQVALTLRYAHEYFADPTISSSRTRFGVLSQRLFLT